MGLFGIKKEGGLMDTIRCDQGDEYLIWKWSPAGEKSRKENAIRYGSSLRVQEAEVAVFVYKQSDGTMQDFIEGPFDQTIKTANFPVLTSIVGAAYGGSSPFQAEIYFINLVGSLNVPFFIKDVNIIDPRVIDYPVPATVKGNIVLSITDYKKFIKKNGLRNLFVEDFKEKIKDNLRVNVASSVSRCPKMCNTNIYSLYYMLTDISRAILPDLQAGLEDLYGINVNQVNISSIVLDEQSEAYKRFDKIIKGRSERIADEQTEAAIRNLEDERQLNLDYRARMNEEAQRMQKLQSESQFITAHQINVQGDVAKTAAESLGELGNSSGMSMGGNGGGMNPAAMMTGMMMGTAVGGSMTNMMGNMMQGVSSPQPPPPPPGTVAEWHIVNRQGAQSGPYNLSQIKQLIMQGEVTPDSYVWKQGMPNWAFAKDVVEIAMQFGAVPPPPPPTPQVPPVPHL